MEAEEKRMEAEKRAQDRADTEGIFEFPNITEYLGVSASGIDAMTFDSECSLNLQADKKCESWLTERANIQAAREESERKAEEKKRAGFVGQVNSKAAGLPADKALMVVMTDAGWSGGIRDSGSDYYSVSGYGFEMLEFECSNFGSYGVTAQMKARNIGPLELYVVKGDRILDQGYTDTKYGIVSLNGSC
jgi:hypothetical protein